MKWIVVATAPDQMTAEMWSDLLRADGVPAQVRAGDTSSFLGVSFYPCRVMVPQGHEAEAIAVLSARLTPEEMEHLHEADGREEE